MLNIDIFFSILKLDNLDQNVVDSNQLVCLLSKIREEMLLKLTELLHFYEFSNHLRISVTFNGWITWIGPQLWSLPTTSFPETSSTTETPNWNPVQSSSGFLQPGAYVNPHLKTLSLNPKSIVVKKLSISMSEFENFMSKISCFTDS